VCIFQPDIDRPVIDDGEVRADSNRGNEIKLPIGLSLR
jgi:hypothetical protein